jgi:hypothetical protein
MFGEEVLLTPYFAFFILSGYSFLNSAVSFYIQFNPSKILHSVLNNYFVSCWLLSSNHKYIGTLYFIFGSFSGILGLIVSMLMRFELSHTGDAFLFGNYQMYNALVIHYGIVFTPLVLVLLGFRGPVTSSILSCVGIEIDT